MKQMMWCHSLILLVSLVASGLAKDAPNLLDAVKRRDHKALTQLIKAKADVNVTQPDGASALAWAIYLDDQTAAEMLLAAGAKVNTADEYGETPLTLACNNGNLALVQKLLVAGAEVKAARWDGSTALMLAANSGNAAIVKLLIEKGAEVNAKEKTKGQGKPRLTEGTSVSQWVLALFAVDALTNPDDYEHKLSVCETCGVVGFDGEHRGRRGCPAHH